MEEVASCGVFSCFLPHHKRRRGDQDDGGYNPAQVRGWVIPWVLCSPRLQVCTFLICCCMQVWGVVHIHTHFHMRPKQQQEYNLGRLRFYRRGASTPLWGVEACSLPSRRPNPIPALPPQNVRTPHLHGAPTTEETVKL